MRTRDKKKSTDCYYNRIAHTTWLVVLWKQTSVSNGFQDIQWRMWCNKQPLNKGHGHFGTK